MASNSHRFFCKEILNVAESYIIIVCTILSCRLFGPHFNAYYILLILVWLFIGRFCILSWWSLSAICPVLGSMLSVRYFSLFFKIFFILNPRHRTLIIFVIFVSVGMMLGWFAGPSSVVNGSPDQFIAWLYNGTLQPAGDQHRCALSDPRVQGRTRRDNKTGV